MTDLIKNKVKKNSYQNSKMVENLLMMTFQALNADSSKVEEILEIASALKTEAIQLENMARQEQRRRDKENKSTIYNKLYKLTKCNSCALNLSNYGQLRKAYQGKTL